MRALFCVLLMSVSGPAVAQSSLGITGAAFSLGATEDEGGNRQVEGAAAVVDVAITSVHGFQGDLSFADTVGGGIGTVGAHLYMAPVDGQKYGLFASLSDVDGSAMLWGTLGAEGMLSMGENTIAEVRGGFGYADEGGLDFIFGGIGLAHAFSPSLTVEGALDLADFDEADFRATAYDFTLKTDYSPEGSPWGAYASVTYSGLTGRDDAKGEVRLGLGLSLSLGNVGGADTDTRLFRNPDPVAPLLRRGLY
ncbi:MAG: hypothetical protein HKN27_09970 [Silicimonas sp.]|nr:hypothetical protein [Silicimonas sp.]